MALKYIINAPLSRNKHIIYFQTAKKKVGREIEQHN